MQPFDPKCLELADHFLADEPASSSLTQDERRHLLAAAIQDAIEDWLSNDRAASEREGRE